MEIKKISIQFQFQFKKQKMKKQQLKQPKQKLMITANWKHTSRDHKNITNKHGTTRNKNCIRLESCVFQKIAFNFS